MKSNAHPPLYFSMYPLNSRNREQGTKIPQQQSPYLRAILSGKGGSAPANNLVRMMNSDKLAAIRYIRESRTRKDK